MYNNTLTWLSEEATQHAFISYYYLNIIEKYIKVHIIQDFDSHLVLVLFE